MEGGVFGGVFGATGMWVTHVTSSPTGTPGFSCRKQNKTRATREENGVLKTRKGCSVNPRVKWLPAGG